MARNKVSISAYCPFYKSDDHQVIRCEGVVEGCTIHLAFADYRDFATYRDAYCKTRQCTECRVARMLYQKWEEAYAEAEKLKVSKPKDR